MKCINCCARQPRCNRHADARATPSWYRFYAALVMVLIILPIVARADAAVPPKEPIGYVRSVQGTGRIVSGVADRDAEPFGPIYSDDAVVVSEGSVVVCDMRTGEQFDVQAGTPFSLPPSPRIKNGSIYQRFLAALKALHTEPAQTRVAAARGRSTRSTPWPDQVTFAPQAYIQFRWSKQLKAGSFQLQRLGGQS